jgi:IS30 family transposase
VLGRPRALTQAQIDAILDWHDSRVTLKQLAASLGVSTSTVVHVIQSRGSHYKQAPPEQREESLKESRAHRRVLRAAHWL